GPIRPQGELDARSNHSTPDVSAAVGSVSVGSASRLVRVRPGSAAGDVDQGVVNNQAGATAERAAYIRFGFDPESYPIDDRICDPAVSVQGRFDADQTMAELVVVADLYTAREKAVRGRRGRTKKAKIVEVR